MKHTPKAIVRESKFRQIVVESRGAQDGFREIHASDFSSAGEMVASSGAFVAYATNQNEVQVIPVKDTDRKDVSGRVTLRGHTNGPVLDLAFSTLDYNLLASGGSDGTVKIWRPNESGDVKTTIECKGARAISNVRWHPSCAGVLAASGSSLVNVFDVESNKQIATYDAKKDISSAAWNWNGSSLAVATASDKTIRILDPRTREIAFEIENAYSANKPILCEWTGRVEYGLLATGHSMNRDREMCLFDLRQTSAAQSRTRCDQNSGILRPLVDVDSNLVFLCGHGDSNVRLFEFDSAMGVHPIGNYLFAEAAKSYCLLAKPACDVMGCEVDRIFRLLPTSIEGVRCEVPRRKAYRDFQEDLFPDTRAPRASLTVDQYVGGENADPALDAVKTLAAIHSTSEETQERAAIEVEEDISEREERERVEREEQARLAEKHEELDKRFSKFLGYQAKMKFARGYQSKRDDSCYNLTPDCGGSDSTNLACSSKFFAVPWKGNAGPIYVGTMSKPGKLAVAAEAPVLNAHSSTVNCLAFDEFDDNVFASGSDDCTVRVWRLPESGVNNVDDAQQCVSTSVKMEGGHRLSVRGIQFHRLCKDLLVSLGSDASVKLWDVSTQQSLIELDESTLGPSGAWNCDWSYDGATMALAGRDSEVKIVDPRAWKGKLTHHFQSHEGLKGSRVCWLSKEPALVTTGFSKTGDRQFKLWDNRMFGTDRNRPLSVHALDAGAGVILPYYVEDNAALLLYAKGENTIRIFEIEGLSMAHEVAEPGKSLKRDGKKFDVHRCTEYKCTGEPTAGLAFLPRRCVNYKQAEWLAGVRLTPTMVESISFSVPRSSEIQGYFYDDLYPAARSAEPALKSPLEWSKGATCAGPNRVDLNSENLKVLSQRPASEAHLAIKRGVASTDRMKKEQEETERRKKEQQDALDRMQRLAMQHEKYNPNLSKSGVGHDAALGQGSSAQTEDDDEWDD